MAVCPNMYLETQKDVWVKLNFHLKMGRENGFKKGGESTVTPRENTYFLIN